MRVGDVEELVRDWKTSNDSRFRLLQFVAVNGFVCGDSVPYRAAYSKKGRIFRKINVCANMIESHEDMKEVLLHELVHVNDDVRWSCDFNNSDELACTEIRAANFAECSQLTDLEARKICVQNVSEASVAPHQIRNVQRMMSKCFSEDTSNWTFTRDQL
jgi:hypothetical protein